MAKQTFMDSYRDIEQENIVMLREITLTTDNYQAKEDYKTLMENINKDLRKSGQPAIPDSKMNTILKGLLKLIG
tara:strand:- start:721 stop:942 length:222 start_codon:yes stop_codon:yes gene_type:complete